MNMVSDEEERKISEILERGINEMQFSKSILKSSIINANSDRNSDLQNLDSNRRSQILENDKDSSDNHSCLYSLKSNSKISNASCNIKSSALRQLLDEMKTNPNYASSSEDESRRNFKFNKQNNDLPLKENLLSNKEKPQHYEKLFNSGNEKVGIEKEKINPMKSKGFQESHLSFDDMKFDIKNLQNKINGLERKLFDSENEEKPKTNSLSEFKKLNSVDIKKTTKKRQTRSVDDKLTQRNIFKATTKNFVNDSIRNSRNMSSSSQKSFAKKQNFSTLTGYHSGGSNNIKILKNNQIEDLKTKNQELKLKYQSTKQELKSEKNKYSQLEKNHKRILDKEKKYDKLNKNYKDLNMKYSKLLTRLDESELIRKEQARLIKSMQEELDILRSMTKIENMDLNSEPKSKFEKEEFENVKIKVKKKMQKSLVK